MPTRIRDGSLIREPLRIQSGRSSSSVAASQMSELPGRSKPAAPSFRPTSNLTALAHLLRRRPSLSSLKQLHAHLILHSLSSYPPSFISSLICCYLHRHRLASARFLFDNYPSSSSPPTLIWNLLIRAHSKIPHSFQSISYFSRMAAAAGDSAAKPDDYTYTFVVTSCSHQNWAGHGRVVHGLVIRSGFESGLFVSNALVNMYSVFGDMGGARKVFDEMPERDVFSWTSLLGGFAKIGEIDSACEVFDQMRVKNDVSWGVMISGLVSNQKHIEALRFFRQMLSGVSYVRPNEAVLVCALSACAHLGALDMGIWIHGYVDRVGIGESSNVCTALIDMYAKCGRIGSARRVFDGIRKQDVHNFTSMISGLSIHGLGKEAVELFHRMVDEDVKPNEVTLLVVLNGCSHAGMVEEGTLIFNSMERSWGYLPKIEHYGSYVDLLGRGGRLEKALEVVKSMPMEPDIVIWRALLSACRIHRNITVGKLVIDHIRDHSSDVHKNGEVLLSNLYASLGKWEDVSELRKVMGKKRKISEPGCSWIELNGVIHEFRVDDRLHPRILEIREKLNEMLEKARVVGYNVSVTQVNFDLSEEDKQQAIARHSEKLAVAFAILNTQAGGLIRVVKNLRTCEDCHAALKAISLVYGRKIVVRDRSRFHVFKAGECSCKDYW